MPEDTTNPPASPLQDRGVMEGKGFYNTHSRPQHSAISFGLPLLARAIESVPLPAPGEVFLIADYGVAGGHNSIEPVRSAIQFIRNRGAGDMAISVVHTDLPTNDFDPLFALLASPDSYLAGASNVFAYAEGKSFYERVFPEAQVHIGWNAIAVHWLSVVPVTIPHHIWSNRATGSVKEAFAQQSRQDWQQFLGYRAHELKPGGRLVVLGGASADDGSSGAEGLMDMANAALHDMVNAGTLRSDEYERMVIPTYNRTLAEFKAPFAEGLIGNLELESSSMVVLDDPIWRDYLRSGDATTFAATYADFFRAAYGPSLFGALDATRTLEERQRIADAFYRKLRDKVSADCANATCNWHVALLLIAKLVNSPIGQ
jgi:hypothetical protein